MAVPLLSTTRRGVLGISAAALPGQSGSGLIKGKA
jgi:hypothetical protein